MGQMLLLVSTLEQYLFLQLCICQHLILNSAPFLLEDVEGMNIYQFKAKIKESKS